MWARLQAAAVGYALGAWDIFWTLRAYLVLDSRWFVVSGWYLVSGSLVGCTHWEGLARKILDSGYSDPHVGNRAARLLFPRGTDHFNVRRLVSVFS